MDATRALRVTIVLLAALPIATGFDRATTALAPQHERMREMAEVWRRATEAATALSRHGPIDDIVHMGGGIWRFRAGRCFVPVAVSVVPSRDREQRAGAPIVYRTSLGAVICD